MSFDVVKDSTDVILYVVIRDSVTGVLETGFDVTTLDFQYTRTGATPSVKQDVTALVATNSAHGDNKAIEVDATNSPGLCRVDFPDAAFATGVDAVILNVTGAGFDISPKEIALVVPPPIGAGATSWTYTLTSTVAPNNPIADADVWVTSDIGGNNVIASGVTDANGQITFFLDDGSTVYVWSQKSGWNFTNPDTEVVS